MSILTQNTTALQELLAKINQLPAEKDLTPIVEALTEKGQTVPDGAGVDVLASLIAAIESGGGAKATGGTITFSSATGAHSWEHGLGEVPTYAVIFLQPGYSATTHTLCLRSIFKKNGAFTQDNYVTKTSSSNCSHESPMGSMSATKTTVDVSEQYFNGNLSKFVSGKPYTWICATGVEF